MMTHCTLVSFLTIFVILQRPVQTNAALGEVNRIRAVEGSRTILTCGRPGDDAVLLVVWYKGSDPIYSYDSRDSTKAASQWVDRDFLNDRSWRGGASGGDPAALILDPLRASDAGEFRCRVDFRSQPTRNYRIIVTVIVPPQKPTIFDERGREVQLGRAGPYPEGSDLRLTCMVSGGSPPPTVEWWRDDILVDSADTSSAFPRVKANQLNVRGLQRKDRGGVFICKASNTDLAPAVSSSVTIDMYLRPTALNISPGSYPLSADRKHEMACEVLGSHPPPEITWWLGDTELTEFSQKDSEDGNVTISTLNFTPKREDNGRMLTCRARNVHVDGEHIETAMQLDVHYPPKLKLHLGINLNPEDIEEGDDVYFECKVNANPSAYKVLWKHNNQILQHNQRAGIITSSSHMALQNVARSQAGNYTCLASNVEGDGFSNSVELKVMYKPVCLPEQKKLYGLAKGEKTSIYCSVESYPPPKSFRWAFNNTAETRELQEPQTEENQPQFTSMLNYTPSSEMDYGTILCWASNLAGRQNEPCVYHVIAGGKPDPPYNCTLLNQTTESVDVYCLGGFDGGQTQIFVLEVYDQETGIIQANLSSPVSHFIVTGLNEGKNLFMAIYAANTRGRSEIANLEGFTLKQAEKQTEQAVSLEVTSFAGILIGIAITAIFLTTGTIFLVRWRGKSSSQLEQQQPVLKDKGSVQLACETESLYGDKNPDVIKFNKGTFHREPGFPESDYQLGGNSSSCDRIVGEENWHFHQIPSQSASSALPELQNHHFCQNNVNEMDFNDHAANSSMNFLIDSPNIKIAIPSYGSLEYGKTVDSTVTVRPIREIVTVRTPLMLNNQQESCV